MVNLETVEASNAQLKELGSGLVAVFVGGTSGIGEYSLKAFVEHTLEPRVYIIGRNGEAAGRIAEAAKQLNQDAAVHFIKSDISLLRNVDKACKEIQSREERINLLFMSPGIIALRSHNDTSEGIDIRMSLYYYARMRFATNLLPELTAAANTPTSGFLPGPMLSRIVNVHAPGREGDLNVADLGLRTGFSMAKFQAHAISMNALFSEELARRHPKTSIVNSHPGTVRTNLLKRHSFFLGLLEHLVMAIAWLIGRYVPEAECGERQLFAATASKFPPAEIGLGEESKAVGSDGERGSGAYLIDAKGEKTGKDAVLKGLRDKGRGPIVWEHTMEVFANLSSP